jgi:hypothetical protein
MDSTKVTIPSVRFSLSTTITEIVRNILNENKVIEKLDELSLDVKQIDESLQTVLDTKSCSYKSIDKETILFILNELHFFEILNSHSYSINSLRKSLVEDDAKRESLASNINDKITVVTANRDKSFDELSDRIKTLEEKLNIVSSSIETTDHTQAIEYLSQKMEFKDKANKQAIEKEFFNLSKRITELEVGASQNLYLYLISTFGSMQHQIDSLEQKLNSSNTEINKLKDTITAYESQINDNIRTSDQIYNEYYESFYNKINDFETVLKEKLNSKVFDAIHTDIVETRKFFLNKMKSLDDKLDTVASSIEKTDHSQAIDYLSQKLEFKDKDLNNKINDLKLELNSLNKLSISFEEI